MAKKADVAKIIMFSWEISARRLARCQLRARSRVANDLPRHPVGDMDRYDRPESLQPRVQPRPRWLVMVSVRLVEIV